jgi:peroxiredoxin Q/BCP
MRTNDLLEGNKAPAFSRPTDGDGTVTLADLKGSPVVLYFYPKDDTPGCTKEAMAFTRLLEEFTEAGAKVIGVSKDTVAKHDKFKNKYALEHTLAADLEGKTCEDDGVWVEKKNYGRTYMGIMRATFLIDGNGVLAKIWPKVKVDSHAAEVLEAVEAL